MKALSHIYVMQVVLDDASNHGRRVTIPGYGEYDVDARYNVSPQFWPYYFAGAIGPDGFPDMITGQAEIHTTTDVWLHYMHSLARQRNQSDVWAFWAGYQSHCLADMWTHDWVNHYAGRPWPPTAQLTSTDSSVSGPAWQVVARHIAIERNLEDSVLQSSAMLRLTSLDVPVDLLTDCILNTGRTKYRQGGNASVLSMPKLDNNDPFGDLVDLYWQKKNSDPAWAKLIREGFEDWIRENLEAWIEIVRGMYGTGDALAQHWKDWFTTNVPAMMTGVSGLKLVPAFVQFIVDHTPIEALKWLVHCTADNFVDMALVAALGKDKAAINQLLNQHVTAGLFYGDQSVCNRILSEIGDVPSPGNWGNITRNTPNLNGPLYNSVVTTKMMLMAPHERRRFLEELCFRPLCNQPIDFPQGIVALDGSGQFAAGDFAPFWHDFLDKVGKSDYASAFRDGYRGGSRARQAPDPDVGPNFSCTSVSPHSPKAKIEVRHNNGQGGFDSPIMPAVGEQGLQNLVAGKFSHYPNTNLLWYEPVCGKVGCYNVSAQGHKLASVSSANDWRRTWQLIIPGNFGGAEYGAYTDLLFYDPTQGHGEFYYVDDCTLVPNGRHTNWRKTWRSIVPGNFGGQGTTDLFFYDPSNKQGHFYATDGHGGIEPIGNTIELDDPAWLIIVPGNFTGSPYTELLFYAPDGGNARFYRTDGHGGLACTCAQHHWRSTWRAIVPGAFVQGGYTSLLFYDPTSSEAELYEVQPANNSVAMQMVAQFQNWSGHRLIASGGFGSGKGADLICYGVAG